jgi:hypothetical protein
VDYEIRNEALNEERKCQRLHRRTKAAAALSCLLDSIKASAAAGKDEGKEQKLDDSEMVAKGATSLHSIEEIDSDCFSSCSDYESWPQSHPDGLLTKLYDEFMIESKIPKDGNLVPIQGNFDSPAMWSHLLVARARQVAAGVWLSLKCCTIGEDCPGSPPSRSVDLAIDRCN